MELEILKYRQAGGLWSKYQLEKSTFILTIKSITCEEGGNKWRSTVYIGDFTENTE